MKRTFAAWMAEVDTLMVNICGLGADDLPDHCYRDDYDAGMQPRHAAGRAITAAAEG